MLEYLTDETDQRRFTIDGENVIKLKPAEWFSEGVADVAAVYDKIEKIGDDRRPDATVMGIMAIFAHDEASVIEEIPPFGRGGLGGSWSQGQAFKKYEGVDKNLIRYFGLMHLLAEIANKPGGICD
jgi:hypothetical protein